MDNKLAEAQRYADEVLMRIGFHNMMSNRKFHWRTRIMSQPFFGEAEDKSMIKIRIPNRYKR